MGSGLTQVIAPIKGGKMGTESVVRERLTEEAQMAPVFSGAHLVDLASVLAGEGRGTWSLASGSDNERALALGVAPVRTGDTEKDAKAVADWLAQDSRAGVETVALGAVVPLPKSWSLLALSDEQLRLDLMAAMDEAAQSYLDVMREGSEVRIHDRSAPPGEQWAREQPKALRGWAAGHGISGAGDPHLHLHIIIATRAEGSSGRRGHLWQPGIFSETARQSHGAAMFVLRQVVEAHGYALDSLGEIAGIGEDRELIDKASRAHTSINMIQAAFAARRIHIDDNTAWERWRQLRSGRPIPGLRPETVEEIKALVGEDRTAESVEHSLDQDLSDDERRGWLVKHWSEIYGQDLTELAAKARQAAANAPALTNVDRLVALVADARRAPRPETVRGWAIAIAGVEGAQDLMELTGIDARVLAGTSAWATTARALDEIAIVKRVVAQVPAEEMTPEQALSTTDARLTVVSGVAGSGKTTLLVEASKTWRGEHREIWAASRNARTARDVGHDLACPSSSLTKLRSLDARGEGPKKGSVLVVDEVGLLDHPDIELILRLAEAGVIVKGLGDERQLSSIDGTTSARLLIETARRQGQPWKEETQRCASWKDSHDALRKAVESAGNLELIEEAAATLTIVAIARAVDAVELQQDAQIVVALNATRTAVGRAIYRPKEPLKDSLIARIRDDEEVWMGDRVIIRENLGRVGGRDSKLANGDGAVVISVDRKSVVVQKEKDGKRVDEPVTLIREVAQHTLALGGVWTADSAQGQNFDKTTVVVTGIEAGEWIYSAATRSRAVPVIAVVVGEDVPVEQRQKRAEEMVTRALARSTLAFSCNELARSDEQFARAARERGLPLDLFRSPTEREAADVAEKAKIAEAAAAKDAKRLAEEERLLDLARAGRWAGSATRVERAREMVKATANALSPERPKEAVETLRRREAARAAAMKISPRLVAMLDEESAKAEASAREAAKAARIKARAAKAALADEKARAAKEAADAKRLAEAKSAARAGQWIGSQNSVTALTDAWKQAPVGPHRSAAEAEMTRALRSRYELSEISTGALADLDRLSEEAEADKKTAEALRVKAQADSGQAKRLLGLARAGRWAGSATRVEQARGMVMAPPNALHPERPKEAVETLRRREAARAAAMKISPRLVALLDEESAKAEAVAEQARAAKAGRAQVMTQKSPSQGQGYGMSM